MLSPGFSHLFRKSSHLIYRMFLGSLLVGIAVNSNPARGAPQTLASSSSLLAWDQINTDGFGNANFNSTLSLAVFRNELYAGTRNSNAAKVFRRNDDSQTWSDLGLPIFCDSIPAMVNAYENILYVGTESQFGSQVWQFDGGSWTNIDAAGFGNAANLGVRTLYQWGSVTIAGTSNGALGAGTFQYNYPNWTQIYPYGFGYPSNTTVSSMALLQEMGIMIGTRNEATGAEIWLFDNTPAGWIMQDGFGNPHNWAASSMAVFNGVLYVGTLNITDGAQIWRYTVATDSWQKVANAGFGNSQNRGISVLYPFAGYLYAGTENINTGAQIWRSNNGSDWEIVMSRGYGNINNTEVASLVGLGGWLIAGTVNYATGSEIWRSHPLGADPYFKVSLTSWNAVYPDLAYNPELGQYLVAWEDRDNSNSLGISAQRFDPESRIAGTISISSQPGELPQVAYDSDLDRYLVAWNEGDYIVGQLVGANGNLIGSKIHLHYHDELTGLLYSPVTDDYVLLYTIYGGTPHPRAAGLNVMVVEPDLQSSVDYIVVRPLNTSYEIFGADLAWNHAHNEVLVAWSEATSHGIYVQGRLVELATPDVLDSAFTIEASSSVSNKFPSVAAIGSEPPGTGTYLVAWQSMQEYTGSNSTFSITGKKVNGNGVVAGNLLSITQTPPDQFCPQVAANEAAHSFFTAYVTGYNYDPYVVYQNRYPLSFGRFLVNIAGAVSAERWLGGGHYLYDDDCASAVGGGGLDYMVVKSFRAPNESSNQVWATRIGLSQVYLPFIRK